MPRGVPRTKKIQAKQAQPPEAPPSESSQSSSEPPEAPPAAPPSENPQISSEPPKAPPAAPKSAAEEVEEITVTTVHPYPLFCHPQGVRIEPAVGNKVKKDRWIKRQMELGYIREF